MNKSNMSGLKKTCFTSLLLVTVVIWAYYLKYQLLFSINVNWDEFRFLSRIYDYLRGDSIKTLQTFYVHFFTWLPSVATSEIDQITSGRQVMYVLSIGSSISLWLIGRRLMNSAGALFAVCCSLSFSYYQHHGSSFRFDSILVFLFLLSVALLFECNRCKGSLIFVSLLIAACFLISIKAVFFIPTWGVILLLRNSLIANNKVFGWKNLKRCFQYAVAVGLWGTLLLFLHKLSLPAAASGGGRSLGEIWGQMILWEAHFPQFKFLVRSLNWDDFFWVLFFFGLLLTAGDAVHLPGHRRFQAIMLLSLAFPLLSLIIYRNTFPYYYVTIIPSASLLTGILVSRISWWLPKRPFIAFLLTALLILPLLQRLSLGYANNQQDQTISQREVINMVHELFPSPVPYLDRCSMISSYPQVGLFMTTWVMGKYRNSKQPIMRKRLATQQPKFLLNNIAALNLAIPWINAGDRRHRLLEEDYKALQANFIHFWGSIWLPGKKVLLKAIQQSENFEILIEGTYRIETAGKVLLDGISYEPNQALMLKQGMHRVVALESAGIIRLCWSTLIDKPDSQPYPQVLFTHL